MDASVSASARLASAPVRDHGLERGVERQPALFFAHPPETPELRARGIDAVPRAFPLNQRRRLPAGPHSRDGREDGRLGRIGRAAGPRRQRPEQVVAEPSRQSSFIPAIRRHLDGREAGGERQPGRSGQHSRAVRAFDDPERGLVAGDGRPAKRKGPDRAEPRRVLRGFCERARLRRAQPLEREHQRRKRREPAKCGRGRRRIGRRPLAEHALREQDRVETPAPERKGDARDARGEPRGVNRRRLAVARRFARLHRGERHVDRRVVVKHALPDAADHGPGRLAAFVHGNRREQHGPVEQRPREWVDGRLPAAVGEGLEKRAQSIVARGGRQVQPERKPLPRRVQVRDRIIKKRELAVVVAEDPLDERRGAAGIDARQRRPQWLRVRSSRDQHAAAAHVNAAAERREERRLLAHLKEGFPIGPQPREGLVVQRGQAVVEQRRAAVVEDGGHELDDREPAAAGSSRARCPDRAEAARCRTSCRPASSGPSEWPRAARRPPRRARLENRRRRG